MNACWWCLRSWCGDLERIVLTGGARIQHLDCSLGDADPCSSMRAVPLALGWVAATPSPVPDVGRSTGLPLPEQVRLGCPFIHQSIGLNQKVLLGNQEFPGFCWCSFLPLPTSFQMKKCRIHSGMQCDTSGRKERLVPEAKAWCRHYDPILYSLSKYRAFCKII